ncbi:hypothetical protein GH714_008421 [Hevea brasiliensis]|uniref:hAT-like transposase RNase-H fold domain-containing protein n=1 Tax=Hevea brasiliensis TaxID=3981 RepID=A0A6A6KI10_HEVBR|nr:hypothetical protein GH714_008421 [Hevea brasiliensis]
MVSRNTIKKDILNIYDINHEKLYKQLKKLISRIAIITDMWTSNQKKGYMSITAHYIDDAWVLKNCILRFVYAPMPHTKEELARHLMDAFTKWNIEKKISTITVDNYFTNDAIILDPRYKMKVVEYYFPMIYGENAWSEIEQIETTCYNLLTDYQSKVKPESRDVSSIYLLK